MHVRTPFAALCALLMAVTMRHLEQVGRERVAPLLNKIVKGLRAALLEKDADVFVAAMAAVRTTSTVMKDSLNPHLKALLMQISKRALLKKFRDDVTLTLQARALCVPLCCAAVG